MELPARESDHVARVVLIRRRPIRHETHGVRVTKQDTRGGHRDRRSEGVALVAVDLKSSGLITESGAERPPTDYRRVGRVSDERVRGMHRSGSGEGEGRI